VRALLADDSIVRVVDSDPELTLIGDSLKVSGNGYLFAVVRPEELKGKLEDYARYKFLQQLSSSVPGLKAEVRLVLLKDGKPDTAATNARVRGGRLETYEGDQFTLWVRNTGRKDAYVNILDMQPDGVINPVLPNRNMDNPIYSQDLKIPAGQEYFLPGMDKIGIAPPCGTEVYKVFVSPVEIDVQDLANTRGATKGVMRAIEKLVRNSYNLSRGAPSMSLPSADVTTSEYVFVIKPKP
jgi:metacaspase-1